MTIKLQVRGVQYTDFIDASVQIRLDALCRTYTFRAAGAPLPFRGGESCRVIVDDEPVLTGSIEVVQGEYDTQGHMVTVRGRDLTGDLLDSSIADMSDVVAPTSLASAVAQVISHLGLALPLTDLAGPGNYNPAEDTLAPEPGVNAWQYIEQLARKRQVLITADRDGGLVIADTPGPKLANAGIRNVVGRSDNNVLSASFSYDTTGRFNSYVFDSQLSPLAVNRAGATGNAGIVAQSTLISDGDIRRGRQLALISEFPSSSEELERRALWEANVRRARGVTYKVVVRGFRAYDGGPLWPANARVDVQDDFAGIRAEMLINAVDYSYSPDSGSTTTLSMVLPNSYSLQLSEPVGDVGL